VFLGGICICMREILIVSVKIEIDIIMEYIVLFISNNIKSKINFINEPYTGKSDVDTYI
jgi:hypothetical protein